MSMTGRQFPSLVQCFSDFYQEIAIVKEAIADGSLPALLMGNTGAGKTAHTDMRSIAAMVNLRLYSFLLKQKQQVEKLGTEQEQKIYRIALYVMAALADEIFILELPWDGQRYWADCLLETRLFHTSMAGRNLFKYADNLLRVRGSSAIHQELATVFLMAFQLGFKGQYSGRDGKEFLANLRRDLLHFIGYRCDGEKPAFPQPLLAQYKLQKHTSARIAPASRWYWLGAGALLVYLLVSSAVWLQVAGSVTDTLPSRCNAMVQHCNKLDGAAQTSCRDLLARYCPQVADESMPTQAERKK